MKFGKFFFLLFSALEWAQNNFFVSANYKLTVMEYEIFVKNDTKLLNMDKIKLKRKSRNEPHKFYGEYTIFRNVTHENDLYLEAWLYQKQGGEYRKLPYHLKGIACALLDADYKFFPSMAEASGLTSKVCFSTT